MSENNGNTASKASVFFERAQKVAESENFDYAVDMYLEGLQCDPNAVLEGHIRLREMALLREQKGGKKPSMLEKVKRLRGKTPLEQMLNAEYLLAKDPSHLPYAEAMLKAAVAGDYRNAAKWIADMIFVANNNDSKPSANIYLLLKDSYSSIGLYERAIAALHKAVKLKPQDGNLSDEFKRLEAERTVSLGKYDQDGDFRHSIKDRESQEKLQSQDGVIKTDDYRISAVRDARKALEKNPLLNKNIFHLSDALSDLENDMSGNEAIELLEKAYQSKKDFSFKEQAGKIRIKQARRKFRDLYNTIEKNPDDAEAADKLAKLKADFNKIELEHYQLCVENYPTDLHSKYEYAARLLIDKQYDQAIPLFQQALKDPRHKIPSMNKIGLCFLNKGWSTDAVDVFSNAINTYQIKDDSIAKELRYNLARSYEENHEYEKALELYRKIAQLDFNYRDVSSRVNNLRNKKDEPDPDKD